MSTYDPYGGYGSEMAGTAGAILGGFFIIFAIIMLVALAISIIGVIGQWKAFKKAGKQGWEAIIPYYNMVVACQISGVSPWWVLITLVGGVAVNVIPVIGQIVSFAISIYFLVLLNVSIARSFGKSDGYAAGLIFLSPFFWLVLGGNNSQYVGPKPMNDVVMGWFNKNNNNQPSGNFQQPNMNNQPVNNQPANRFCTACGKQLADGERFCTGCGKEN